MRSEPEMCVRSVTRLDMGNYRFFSSLLTERTQDM